MYPLTLSSMPTLTGYPTLQNLVPYLLDFYASVDKQSAFQWNSASHDVGRKLMATRQTDALLEPSRVIENTALGVTYLPLLLGATQVTFHLPAEVTAYPGVLPLVMDVETVGAIFSGAVRSWLDPRILATNPSLGAAVAGSTVLTGWDPSMVVVVCCSDRTDPLATSNFFAGALHISSVYASSAVGRPSASAVGDLFGLPVNFRLAFYDGNPANVSYRYANDERDLLSTVAAVQGAIGYMMQQSNVSDDTVTVRILPWKRGDSLARGGDAASSYTRNQSLQATPESMLHCIDGGAQLSASDPDWPLDFEHAWLDLDAGVAPPLSCYPLTRLLTMGLPSTYSGLGCTRGNATLNLMAWLVSQDGLSYAAQIAGLARATDHPIVRTAFQAAINKITCDGQPLLITLPGQQNTNTNATASQADSLCDIH